MRKLELKIADKNYILELNRNAIKWLEANGFVLDELDKKLVTFSDLLWSSLFIAHHSDILANAGDLLEIYRKSGFDPFEVIKFAIEEYNAFINALADTKLLKKNEALKITKI